MRARLITPINSRCKAVRLSAVRVRADPQTQPPHTKAAATNNNWTSTLPSGNRHGHAREPNKSCWRSASGLAGFRRWAGDEGEKTRIKPQRALMAFKIVWSFNVQVQSRHDRPPTAVPRVTGRPASAHRSGHSCSPP